MSPDYYVEQLKRYAAYVRNLQSGAAGAERDEADRRRVGQRQQRLHRSGDEGLEGQGLELGHRRPVAALLHGPEQLGEEGPERRLRRGRICQGRQGDAGDGGLDRQALGDHGQATIPRRRSRSSSTSGAPGRDPNPGSNPGFLEQQNTLRDAIVAALNLNIFTRHADRVRMANIAQMVNVLQAMILTDGPKMVLTPTYHVFRMYVPFQDATFVPVTFDAGTLQPRRHHAAARRRDRGEGRVRQAVARARQRRSEPAGQDRGTAWMDHVRSAAGELLTATAVDARNTFEHSHTIVPRPFAGTVSLNQLVFDLPPKSIAVVEVRSPIWRRSDANAIHDRTVHPLDHAFAAAMSLASSGRTSEALQQLNELAQAGHPDGLFTLADCYWRGAGLPQDLGRGRDLFKAASDVGHPMAIRAWTNLLASGIGGPRNWLEALRGLRAGSPRRWPARQNARGGPSNGARRHWRSRSVARSREVK